MKPCCYFYIDQEGKIAYVGKANGTLKERVKAHSKEKKFLNCNCAFEIRYQEFESASDMDMAEKVYIKSLKPYLNVADTTTGFFPMVNLDINALIKYDPAVKKESKPRKKSRSRQRFENIDWSPEGWHKSQILSDIRAIIDIFQGLDEEKFLFHESFFKNDRILGKIVCLFNSNNFLAITACGEQVGSFYMNYVCISNIHKNGRSIALDFLDRLKDYVEAFPTKEIKALEENTDWVVQQFEELKNKNKEVET